MKKDFDPCCRGAFTAVALVQLAELEVSMGAIAQAWTTVKQELADLKAQNAALQDQIKTLSGPALDDADQAAIADLESAAAAVTPPVAAPIDVPAPAATA